MGDDFGIIVFDSTQSAIKTQTLLENSNLKTRILTTPGSLTAGCGLSIFFDISQLKTLKQLLTEQQINYKALYHAHKNGLHTYYDFIES